MRHFAEQLHELRKVKMSRLFCDNLIGMKTVSTYVMQQPEHCNMRVPCSTLPVMDLAAWKDHGSCEGKPTIAMRTFRNFIWFYSHKVCLVVLRHLLLLTESKRKCVVISSLTRLVLRSGTHMLHVHC